MSGQRRISSRPPFGILSLHVKFRHEGGNLSVWRVAYEGWARQPERRGAIGWWASGWMGTGMRRVISARGESGLVYLHGNVRRIQEVILGEDEARSVEKGREVPSQVIRQVDGFHRNRACRQALGGICGDTVRPVGRGLGAMGDGPRREGQRVQAAAWWPPEPPDAAGPAVHATR